MKYTLVRLLIALMAALWLGACQHDSDSTADTESGELSIELTDAKGDFTNYTVDLLSLSLTKKNGSIVEVLPESTRIDFSQYVEMSELLTLATVPEGIYTAATLRLDYQDAEIYVEDAEGNSVKVDSIVDEDGNEVGKLESKVTLEGRDQLSIVPGVPAHLSLDFDLKTSNVVTFDEETEIPGITVSPSLHASLEPAQDKTHRIRGPLKNVNVDSASFELFLRPFNHKINNNQGRFGSVKILTDENTRFEIDGESSVGADGIAIMDETLDKLAAVIVVGDISLNPRRFTATEVYAGSSVPGGTLDVVRGTVLSRTGETLVVHGATLIRAGGSILFNDKVNVLLGADTTVVKREKDDGAYSIADISVGQAVTIFGSLDDDTANLVLDATAGNVRMRITSLLGTVVDPAELTENDAPFELDLATINGRKTALFDFSGTGRDAENDADPAFYEIDTGNLDTSVFGISSPVSVRGFVNSFGQAPEDFIAKSIISMKSVAAVMQTNWRPFTSDAFSSIDTNAITLDFTGAGKFHHIGRRQQRLDLTELGTDFTLVPGEFEEGLYIIHLQGAKHLHSSFENFANDLQDQLNNGALVKKIQANGLFDINTGNFSAKRIVINLQ